MENPGVQSNSLTDYPAFAGVVYAKISPGGKKSEIGNMFSKFTVNQQPFMAKRNQSAHHFAEIHVEGDQAIHVTIWGVSSSYPKKFVVDQFSIAR